MRDKLIDAPDNIRMAIGRWLILLGFLIAPEKYTDALIRIMAKEPE